MNLPEQLQQAIELEAAKFDQQTILAARETLTSRYHPLAVSDEPCILTEAERCAYIVARMPATYSVIARVLKEIGQRLPHIPIESLLDIGAGPGTVMWAAAEAFSGLKEIQLIERDAQLIALGKRLALQAPVLKTAQWQVRNMEHLSAISPHDLVVLSYSIGELPPAFIPPVVEKCWEFTKQLLVIIEPGTPTGFERIRQIRAQLLSMGAYMAAPCPHALACPMAGGDWCHFSERVERSSLHRRIKQGALGYEDEKYSYLVVAKQPIPCLPDARILRYPLKRSGHVVFSLCTANEGLKQHTISKRTPELYKETRKLDWGDSFVL
ncbi:MAG: small ribosomal subunit Rsm22 family protein [Parachlamydiaceae bacterium]